MSNDKDYILIFNESLQEWTYFKPCVPFDFELLDLAFVRPTESGNQNIYVVKNNPTDNYETMKF